MFDPAEPNTVRKIHLTYSTDDEGKVSISLDSVGFEDNPDFVGFYLLNTIKVLSEVTIS